MPVGLSMLITGFLGTVAIRGWTHALPSLSSETFAIASFYQLSIIPMFVLMGNVAGASGMGRDLYDAAYAWVGHIRGGLASATVIACACFASLCGSAAASAVTMGRVALPEMRRFKYDDSLATGTVASGGTLGFIFPPSAGLVIYGLLTEQAIGRLFLAGVIPGIILTLLFLATIWIVTTLRKEAGPAGPRAGSRERIRTLKQSIGIIAIIFMTIGGMYAGLFTPIEASGFGAGLTLIVALLRGKLNWTVLKAIVLQTMRTSATIFLILMGAYVFIPFMTLSQLPNHGAISAELRRRHDGDPGDHHRDLSAAGDLHGGYFHADPDAAGGHAGAQSPRCRSDLVRRGRRAHHSDGHLESAGRTQCLHREGHRSGRAHVHDLSRHLAVLVRDGTAHRPAADVSATRFVSAQQDVRLTLAPMKRAGFSTWTADTVVGRT
jgi:tripartite ATP-independent transporter DctM subunit